MNDSELVRFLAKVADTSSRENCWQWTARSSHDGNNPEGGAA